MSYIAGLLGQLDQRRQETRQQTTAEQEKLGDLEFRTLMQLAQGDDDEIAGAAGAGIMEILAGNSKIGRAKGLQGFLGEASRSSYMPGVQSLLASRKSATPATPNGAALPGGSPVQPGGPQMAPIPQGLPPIPARPTLQGMPDLQAPRDMPGVSRAGLGLPPAAPALGAAMAGSGGGPTGVPGMLGSGMPSLPPPPELPQQKHARLFPSAAQTAANADRAKMLNDFLVQAEMLQYARTTGDGDMRRMVLGRAGAPERMPEPYNVTYLDDQGQEQAGVALLNPSTRAWEIDGIPVQVTRVSRASSAADRGVATKVYNPDTNTYDIVMASSAPGTRIDANMPVPEPTMYQGAETVMVNGKRMLVRPERAGAGSTVLGEAPPPASAGRVGSPTTTPAALQAKGYLKAVTLALKAAEAGQRVNARTGKPAPLSSAVIDAIVAKETGGLFPTWTALNLAAAGSAPPGPGASAAPVPAMPGAFGSPEGLTALLAGIQRRTGAPLPK